MKDHCNTINNINAV